VKNNNYKQPRSRLIWPLQNQNDGLLYWWVTKLNNVKGKWVKLGNNSTGV